MKILFYFVLFYKTGLEVEKIVSTKLSHNIMEELVLEDIFTVFVLSVILIIGKWV